MRVVASAPGKLVLLGEYAVVYGYPAVVMAVDRRARVELEPATDGRFLVAAPEVHPELLSFILGDNHTLSWRSPDGAPAAGLALVDSVLGSLAARGPVELRRLVPFHATLDTRSFFHSTVTGSQKLGLGSSAALTVAFASAIATLAGRSDLLAPGAGWLDRLVGLHRGLQGGRGSGVDLAASLLGGVVEYCLDRSGSVARAEPTTLPEPLHLSFIWTGRPADTTGFLARLSEAIADGHRGVTLALEHLGGLAASGSEALRTGHVSRFLQAVDGYSEGMRRLGQECGLDILSDEHRRLLDLARRHGAHYKPSGAGGGDLGVAFATDPAAAAALEAAARSAGFVPIPLDLDPTGLELDRAAAPASTRPLPRAR